METKINKFKPFKSGKILRLTKWNIQMNPETFRQIAQFSTQWDNIQQLSLIDNRLDEQTMAQFIKLPWRNLKQINMFGCDVNGESLRVFVKHQWNNLEILWLKSNPLSIGIKQLRFHKWLKLKQLVLDVCQLHDEGMKFLSESNFEALQHFSLASNGIGQKGIWWFIRSPNLNLKKIYLTFNTIRTKGWAFLLSHSHQNVIEGGIKLEKCQIGNGRLLEINKTNADYKTIMNCLNKAIHNSDSMKNGNKLNQKQKKFFLQKQLT